MQGLLLALAATAAAVPMDLVVRDDGFVPKALAESAPEDHIKWQPVLDYDTDSCYNVPAIDSDGNTNPGLPSEDTTNTDGCRKPEFLDNQNVYSRKRCNHGWCAYMYEHYFQKDVALSHATGDFSGHRHEWENVVIWVKDGDSMPSWVSASQHDGYETKNAKDVRFQDTHAKIVYNKAGISTHDFRFANEKDDNPVENDKHVWIRGALIAWESWPSNDLRSKMLAAYNGGGIRCKIADDLIGGYLQKSAGENIPGFDVNSDN